MTVVPKCLINSQYAPASAGILYTAPGGINTIVDEFSVTNITSGNVALTVYYIPSGGSAGASNTIVGALSIAANTQVDLTQYLKGILNTGDAISVLGASASSLVVRASGREVTLA